MTVLFSFWSNSSERDLPSNPAEVYNGHSEEITYFRINDLPFIFSKLNAPFQHVSVNVLYACCPAMFMEADPADHRINGVVCSVFIEFRADEQQQGVYST
jgi:hypothetical protein